MTKPTTAVMRLGDDWCHLCGVRQHMKFVTFDVPENAEHSTDDGKRGYFRICKNCVAEFAALFVEAN